MPFVDILWKPSVVAEEQVIAVRDAVRATVASTLTAYDPQHLVTEAMVDVRVQPVGALDAIGPDLYVTVYAREEPARDANKLVVIERITKAARDASCPPDTMVELVLTNRSSVYDYNDA